MTGTIYNGKPWISGVALKRGTREISMEHRAACLAFFAALAEWSVCCERWPL